MHSPLQTLFHTLSETCIKHHYSVVFREQERVSCLESGTRSTTQFQNCTQLERLTHQKASHFTSDFTGGETWLLRNLFFQGDGIG